MKTLRNETSAGRQLVGARWAPRSPAAALSHPGQGRGRGPRGRRSCPKQRPGSMVSGLVGPGEGPGCAPPASCARRGHRCLVWGCLHCPQGGRPCPAHLSGRQRQPCLAGAGASGSAVPRTPGFPEVPPQALGLCLGAWGALGVALGKLCSHRT